MESEVKKVNFYCVKLTYNIPYVFNNPSVALRPMVDVSVYIRPENELPEYLKVVAKVERASRKSNECCFEGYVYARNETELETAKAKLYAVFQQTVKEITDKFTKDMNTAVQAALNALSQKV